MADVLWGDVTSVVDGDTFDVHVTHYGKTNRTTYSNHERVRIASIDAPELPSPAGYSAKQSLERRIGGKHVRLDIQARDAYHRLVCDVRLAPKG